MLHENASLVSIILPTFNRLHFLPATLQSILAQTYKHWELIIVDDGSDEETRAYLKTLEDSANIRLIWLEHTGYPAIARNAALKQARGEYVAFLDSDDVWMPDKLSAQIASLRSHPACLWSYTGFRLVDGAGKPAAKQASPLWTPQKGWIFEKFLREEVAIAMSSVVVTRRLLNDLAGFDEELLVCEDYDLFLRMAQRSEADAIPDLLLCLRRHNEHYSADADAFIGKARSLEKLQLVCTDRKLISLIQEQRAKNAVGLANSYVLTGRRSAALATLMRSVPSFWRHARLWTGVLAATARAALPPLIRNAVRRYRARAAG